MGGVAKDSHNGRYNTDVNYSTLETPAPKPAPQPVTAQGTVQRQELLRERKEQLAMLRDEQAYLTVLTDAKNFPSGPERRDLMEQFRLVDQRIPRDPGEFAGSRMLILARAVSRTFRGSPTDAARALAYLGNVNIMASIGNPNADPLEVVRGIACPVARPGETEAEFDQRDVANAWRLLQALWETPIGTEVSKLMTVWPVEYESQGPAIQDERNSLLRTYMNTAREKIKEAGGNLDPDPHSMYQYLLNHPIKEAKVIRAAASGVAAAVEDEAKRNDTSFEDLIGEARAWLMNPDNVKNEAAKEEAEYVFDVTKEAVTLAKDEGVKRLCEEVDRKADQVLKEAIAEVATTAIAYLPPDIDERVKEDARRLAKSVDQIFSKIEGLAISGESGDDRERLISAILDAARPSATTFKGRTPSMFHSSAPDHTPLMRAIHAALTDPKHQKQIAEAVAYEAGSVVLRDSEGEKEGLSDLQCVALDKISTAAAWAARAGWEEALFAPVVEPTEEEVAQVEECKQAERTARIAEEKAAAAIGEAINAAEEARLRQVEADATKANDQANRVEEQAALAAQKAGKADEEARLAGQKAERAEQNAAQLEQRAEEAAQTAMEAGALAEPKREEAIRAEQNLEWAEIDVETARLKVELAREVASRPGSNAATEKVIACEAKLAEAEAKADAARAKAIDARAQADEAESHAADAQSQAEDLRSQAVDARIQAYAAREEANTANVKATDAHYQANGAQIKATEARAQADAARARADADRANAPQYEVEALGTRVEELRVKAGERRARANKLRAELPGADLEVKPFAVMEAIQTAVPKTIADVAKAARAAVPSEELIPSGTLLDKALLAEFHDAATMDELARHEVNQSPAFTRPNSKTHPYTYAWHANWCGIYTDAEKDEKGNLTQFGRVNSRLLDIRRQAKAAGENTVVLRRKDHSAFNALKLAAEDNEGLNGMFIGALLTGREIRNFIIPNIIQGKMLFGAGGGGPITARADALFPKGIPGQQPAPIRIDPSELLDLTNIDPDNPPASYTTLKNLVYITYFCEQEKRTNYITEYNYLPPFSGPELGRVRRAVYDQLETAGLDPDSEDAIRACIAELCKEQNVVLSVEALEKEMASIPGAPRSIDEAKALRNSQKVAPEGLPDWGRVGEAFALVRDNEIAPLEGANPDGTLPTIGTGPGQIHPEDVERELPRWIVEANKRGEADSAVFMSETGARGFNVRTAMELASAPFLHQRSGGGLHATVGVGPGFLQEKGYLISNDISVSGYEQYYLERNLKTVSMGLSGGIGDGGGLAQNASFAWVWSKLFNKTEGVAVRIGRYGENFDRKNAKSDLKVETANEKASRATAKVMLGSPPPGAAWPMPGDRKAAQSPVFALLQENGVAVNERTIDERGRTNSVTVGDSIPMSMGPFGMPSLRGKVNTLHTKAKVREGAGGAHRRNRDVETTNVNVSVGGNIGGFKVPLTAFLLKHSDDLYEAVREAHPEVTFDQFCETLGLPAPHLSDLPDSPDLPDGVTPAQTAVTGDMLAHDRTVFSKGVTTSYTSVERNGEVWPRSYMTKIYQTHSDFAKAVLEDLDNIVLEKMRRTYGAQFENFDDLTERAEVEAARFEAIRDMLLKVIELEKERGVGGEACFYAYYEMNPNIPVGINHLSSHRIESEKAGEKKLAGACADQEKTVRKDEASYIFKLDLAIGYPTKTEERGILGGVVTWSRKTALRLSIPGHLG